MRLFLAAGVRLLMADDFHKGVRTARVHVDPVRRDLARVYDADGVIAHLEPDLIGEHHVAGVADIELIDGCLRWIEGEPEVSRAQRRYALLRVLRRATQPEHGTQSVGLACDLIDHIVRTQVATLAGDIVSVIRDTRTITSDVLRYRKAGGVEPDPELLRRVALVLGEAEIGSGACFRHDPANSPLARRWNGP
jgi:hypothetical protein